MNTTKTAPPLSSSSQMQHHQGGSSQPPSSRKKKQKSPRTTNTSSSHSPNSKKVRTASVDSSISTSPTTGKTATNTDKESNGGSTSAKSVETPKVSSKIESWQKERILFLFLNLIGQVVEVHTVSGQIFEGLFHTANVPDSKKKSSFDIVLKLARTKKKRGGGNVDNRIIDVLVIHGNDIVQIRAIDITFATESQQYRDESFVTDTEISNRKFKERDLVPWQPSENEIPDSSLLSLDELASGKHQDTAWDQYEINRRFGVTSTYDETLYTTNLDRNSEQYKLREKEAERIAREIERSQISGINSIHIAEERGYSLDDYTEEELFSSVIRPDPLDKLKSQTITSATKTTTTSVTSTGSKKYVPPPQRQKVQQLQSTAKTEEKIEEAPKAQASAASLSKAETKKPSEKSQPEAPEDQKVSALQKTGVLDRRRLTISINTSGRDRTASVSDISSVPGLSNDIAGRTNRSSSFSIRAADLPSSPSVTSLLKERIIFRQQITGSPSLSPVRSPMGSPLSPNAKITKVSSPIATKLQGLDLDPAKPKITENTFKQFLKFTLSSIPSDRSKEIESFKQFSLQMGKKVPAQPTILSNLLGMSKAATSNTAEPPKLATVQTETPTDLQATKDSAANRPEKKTEATPPRTTASKDAEIAPSSSTTITKPKSTLNPNAPAFKFNPNAKSFTPSSTTTSVASTPTASSTFAAPASQSIPAWNKPYVPPAPMQLLTTPPPMVVWTNSKVAVGTPISSLYSSKMKSILESKKNTPPQDVPYTWPTNSKKASYKLLEEGIPEISQHPMVQPIHPMVPPHYLGPPATYLPPPRPTGIGHRPMAPMGAPQYPRPYVPAPIYSNPMYQYGGGPQQFQQYGAPVAPIPTNVQQQSSTGNLNSRPGSN
jgi:hypothetical protein